MVSVTEAAHVYHFVVFFKKHKRLPINKSTKSNLRGDAVVMRLGQSTYVNMRGRDRILADFLMERYVSFTIFIVSY